MGRRKEKQPIEQVTINGAKAGPTECRLYDWSKYDPSQARQGQRDTLADELVTYRDHLKELLQDKGKFVLIKGREVVGIYDRRDDAIAKAIDRFGDAPVLVKQIVAKEPMIELGGAAF